MKNKDLLPAGSALDWHQFGAPSVSLVRYRHAPASQNCGAATGYIATPDHCAAQQTSIQRYEPQDTAVNTSVNHPTRNLRGNDAPPTTSQAGRALPGSDGRPTPPSFDTYQNLGHAKAAAGGESGATESDNLPRSAPDLGQRAQPLDDAPQHIPPPRKSVPLPPGYLPGVV